MKTYLILLLITANINQALADPVVVGLDKGEVAPFTGYLFTPDKEKELRGLDQNLNYYKSLNQSLDTINKAQEDNLNKMQQRMVIRDQQIDSLTKRVSEDKSNFLEKAGYFIFGAVITGLIAQGIYRTK